MAANRGCHPEKHNFFIPEGTKLIISALHRVKIIQIAQQKATSFRMYHFPSNLPLLFLFEKLQIFVSAHPLYHSLLRAGLSASHPTLLSESAFFLVGKKLRFSMSFLLQTQPWGCKSQLGLRAAWKLRHGMWLSVGQGKGQGSFWVTTSAALQLMQLLWAPFEPFPLPWTCLPFPLWVLGSGICFLSAQTHISLLPSYVSLLGKSH